MAVLTATVFGNMIKRMHANDSLESQLVFYGSYHQHPVNVAIHIVFIPLIWWTICIMAAHYPLLGLDLCIPGTRHPITWATLDVIAYSYYYIWLDPVSGGVASVVLFFMYMSACKVANSCVREKKPKGRGFQIAAVLQVLSWYMQIHPGHMVYEGIKPALFDSFGDALSVAPLFASYDVLFLLFPSSAPDSLQARVLAGVAESRLGMCAANSALRFCGS